MADLGILRFCDFEIWLVRIFAANNNFRKPVFGLGY